MVWVKSFVVMIIYFLISAESFATVGLVEGCTFHPDKERNDRGSRGLELAHVECGPSHQIYLTTEIDAMIARTQTNVDTKIGEVLNRLNEYERAQNKALSSIEGQLLTDAFLRKVREIVSEEVKRALADQGK